MKKKKRKTVFVFFSLLICYCLMCLRSEDSPLYIEGVIFLLSIFSLLTAAGRFTELSVVVGDSLGLNKLSTGILIIAIGTSAPEIFASLGAAIQKKPDMVVGNVLGTVVANSLLGIGFGALVAKSPLVVHKEVVGSQMSIFLAAIILSIGGMYDGTLQQYECAIMLMLLICYLRYVIKSNNEDGQNYNDDKEKTNKINMTFVVALLALNLIALFISGHFVVSSLIVTASRLDISSVKLATSILAVGTSIPEIATAIVLVRQNNTDSLFGEIIGSNIFDILGIFGIIGMFTALTMETKLLIFLSISTFLMFVIASTIMLDKRISRIEGLSLISLFAIFTIQLTTA